MKRKYFPLFLPALLVVAPCAVQADNVQFGQLNVVQLNPNDTATDITVTRGPGSSPAWTIRSVNRGDYSIAFGYPVTTNTGDVAMGVPITSISQHYTENPVNNGASLNYTGISYATSSTMAENTEAAPRQYRVVLHRASVGASATTTEVNINSAFAYFPYADWYAGRASNSARTNGGANDLLVGNPGIRLGTEFINLGTGQSTLDLRRFNENSSTGVLLVNHAKDEGNFALSRANADGTFTIINHDNGADASTYEQDPVAFAFVPVSKVGTGNLVAAGRITGNANAEVGAGNFISTKGATGEWLLKIPGYSDANGVLVISPEGGVDTNVDNIIAYQWDATQQGWVIQSRDLNGTTTTPPGLQNLAATVGVYSFAFFSNTPASNVPPTVSVASPAAGSTVDGGSPLLIQLNTADADGTVAKVEVYEDGTKVGEILQPPFATWRLPSPSLGKHTYIFKVIDNQGSFRTSAPFEVNVQPTAGRGGMFFDGTDDYVTFGDAAALKLKTFTLECWFKREGPGVASSTGSGGVSVLPLIAKGRGENDTRTFNCNYFLGVDPTTGLLAADFEDYNSGLNHPVTGKTPTKIGEWNHAAVTFDGKEWRVYLNGVLETMANTGGQIPEWVSIQHASIGSALDSTGTPSGAFCGYMDEVRVWNYARGESEIAAAMNFEIANGGGLVARYGFDQSTGTQLTGTGGVNGTLKNGALWTRGYNVLTPLPNQIPTVALTAPVAGEYNLGSPIALAANAVDADGSVAKVEYFADGEKIAEATSAPFSASWSSASIGSHEIQAKVTDNQGATAVTGLTTISVKPQVGVDGLYFDGVDDYVTFGNRSEFGLRQFTLETWFYKEPGGTTATSGSGGVNVIPLIAHGRGENDNNTFNCNYLFGIRATDGVLAADFEEGPAGSSPGLNHPVAGKTKVTEGAWNHAAATYDGTTWRLYLNGNLEAELVVGQEAAWNTIQHASIGSALNSTGVPEGFFHGLMDETRIWNTARSISEIRSTMRSEITSATGLVARYGMNNLTGGKIENTSGVSLPGTLTGGVQPTTGSPVGTNLPPDVIAKSPANGATDQHLAVDLKTDVSDPDSNVTVKYYGRRIGNLEAGDDFTVIALPDTQYYSAEKNGANASWFSAQTDWVVGEMDARNIKFVMHLGDITDQGELDWQWANATRALYRLENRSTTYLKDGIPYSVAVGNHDQYPNGNADGDTTFYNTYFGINPQTGVSHFAGRNYYGGTQVADSADNYYSLFSAGGVDFIVISLEYDTTPDAEDLEWADSLLKRYPNHRGIIISHYIVGTGNPATFSALGSAAYEKLKTNPNLMMLHGGHIHGEGRRQDTYEGRTVHSLLADFQSEVGGNGWLRIMKFSPKTNSVSIQTYSPTLNRFYTDADSQFSLNVDLQTQWTQFAQIATRENVASGEVSVPWENLTPGTRYEWYATVSDGTTTYDTPLQTFTTGAENAAPQVELTRPVNGSFHTVPATVTLEASASDDVSVAKVQFFNGTELIGEDTEAPYSYTWENVPQGAYTLFAKAIDGEGKEKLSLPVAFSVEDEKPLVTVSATDALAGEFGDDTSFEFTFTRNGNVAGPLTVDYALSGQALPGVDYSGAGTSITIPANESTAKLVLSVLADDLSEGSETAKIAISAATGYDIGNPASATALISDRPAQAWLLTHLAGSPLSAPQQDADGDGRANLLEYYMGSAPDSGSDNAVYEVSPAADPALLEVRYQRRTGLVDVTGGLEWSSDLKTWHASGVSNGTSTMSIQETVTSTAGQVEFVTAKVALTAGAAPERVFVRINVR